MEGIDEHEGYLREATEYWEPLDVVPMRHNRLVLYPSTLFHMPDYDEAAFGDDLTERRLTQNLYLVRE
jgi:Family of unknown function (DUF6445)